MSLFNSLGRWGKNEDAEQLLRKIDIITGDYLNSLNRQSYNSLELRTECNDIETLLITGETSENQYQNGFVSMVNYYIQQILELTDEKEYKAVKQFVRSLITYYFCEEITRIGLEIYRRNKK